MFSMVVIPLIVYNYFTDAIIFVAREYYCGRPDCSPHIIDENDITQSPQIKDWIGLAAKPEICTGYGPCSRENFAFLRVYEAHSATNTLELSHKYTQAYRPFAVMQHTFDWVEDYYGVVEYEGHYYSLDVRIPTQQFINYLPFGVMSAIGGSLVIALAWVKFGQSRDKHNIVQT